jgi:hypothetical protein
MQRLLWKMLIYKWRSRLALLQLLEPADKDAHLLEG